LIYNIIGKAEVTGSSPVISSNYKPLKNPYKKVLSKVFLFSKNFDKFLLKKYLLSIFGAIAVKKETKK